MSKKLQSIYEYLGGYDEETINEVIDKLGEEEKQLIIDRYGNDLHNPTTTSNWNKDKNNKFYGKLIPKIKRMLKNSITLNDSSEENVNANVVSSTKTYNKNLDPTTILDLINLLKKDVASEEICHQFNISKEQLYRELLNLKNSGINYSRKYYSDSSIRYTSLRKIKELKESSQIPQDQASTIITDTKENHMKFLLISDLHFGSSLERLDLVDKAFNYCIKNGINIILCGGDFIDGSFSQIEQKIPNVFQQIDYFIKNYPKDKNILTFGVAGNHDISALNTFSVDFIQVCNNYRHDIIIPGYNNAWLNLKNDSIQMFHHVNAGELMSSSSPIILHGHSHKYINSFKKDILNITIPSLSDINALIPSALELEISFEKGYITNAITKQIYFGNEDIILNESNFSFRRNIKNGNTPIQNVEPYKQTTQKTLVKKNTNLSQVEKFEKRYGKLY